MYAPGITESDRRVEVGVVASGNRDLVRVTYGDLQPGDKDGSLMTGRTVIAVHPLGRNKVELHTRFGSRRERPMKVDAARPATVSRIVVGPGLPLRHRAQARTTGGVVEVWDTHHRESVVQPGDVGGHQYAMRCEHGTAVGRRLLKDAVREVSDPRLWCDDCVMPAAKVGAGAMMLPLL
jgi:hypothetical protein